LGPQNGKTWGQFEDLGTLHGNPRATYLELIGRNDKNWSQFQDLGLQNGKPWTQVLELGPPNDFSRALHLELGSPSGGFLGRLSGRVPHQDVR